MKQYTKGVITSLVFLQKEIVSIWFKEENIAAQAGPGQFVSIYSGDKSRMLPRPISICEVDKEEGIFRVVFRIAGEGTKEFSRLNPGDELDLAGPLGNGYDLSSEISGEDAIIIGGGIGIPPMLELAKRLDAKKEIVLGYRDSNTFLLKDFKKLLSGSEAVKGSFGGIHTATEDGSLGTRGNVIDAIRAEGIKGKVIYACGPMPMLRGIKEYAKSQEVKAFVSLEERMACGIGACLACVCKTNEVDEHSNVNNKRICKDGPVFDADELSFD